MQSRITCSVVLFCHIGYSRLQNILQHIVSALLLSGLPRLQFEQTFKLPKILNLNIQYSYCIVCSCPMKDCLLLHLLHYSCFFVNSMNHCPWKISCQKPGNSLTSQQTMCLQTLQSSFVLYSIRTIMLNTPDYYFSFACPLFKTSAFSITLWSIY